MGDDVTEGLIDLLSPPTPQFLLLGFHVTQYRVKLQKWGTLLSLSLSLPCALAVLALGVPRALKNW